MAEDFRIIYRCAGRKCPLTSEGLNAKIDKLFAGVEKGTVILTPDQAARLHETRDEGLPNMFDIGGVFGLGNDGQAFVRNDCGVDVTELIEAVPFDGEVHEVSCPKCGTVATVRRVPSEEVEAASETVASVPGSVESSE
jgi:hypothetical protein